MTCVLLPFPATSLTQMTSPPGVCPLQLPFQVTLTKQSPDMSAQAVIYKPNEHADEYIVFVEDVAEVSVGSEPLCCIDTRIYGPSRADSAVVQYEQWKTDKSIAMSRFLGQFSIVSYSPSNLILSPVNNRTHRPKCWIHRDELTGEISPIITL